MDTGKIQAGNYWFQIQEVTAWPYWVQLAMLVSVAVIVLISRFSDEGYCRKALFIVSAFVGAFALYMGYYRHDVLTFGFFGLMAVAGAVTAKKYAFDKMSLRNALAVFLLPLWGIIFGFNVFSYVYFDDRIYINSPFRLYTNGYILWSVFAVAAAFFTFRFFKRTIMPGKMAARYAASCVILAFWLTFFAVKVLDRGTFVYSSAFNEITRHLFVGVGANATNDLGETALHHAVKAENIDEVKRLVENGADPNAQTTRLKGIRTPFERAIQSGNYEIFSYLLEHGADVNLIDEDGSAPIHFAAKNKTEDTRFLKDLLSRGADIHTRNQFGSQPIHLAAEGGYLITEKRFLKTDMFVEFLAKNGADVNDANGHFGTPLHMAVFGANTWSTKKLVELGADPSIRNKENKTPLEMAIRLHDQDVKLGYELSKKKAVQRAWIIEYLRMVSR